MFCKILNKRNLTDHVFVLQFERKGMVFEPGQHILVARDEKDEMREYSIYSGINDPYLEIIVREVEDGVVSKQLKRLEPGESILVESPAGFFRIEKENRHRKFLFVATGTGISPFRCFVRSYPGLDYTILHGIRYPNERYEFHEYEEGRYIACLSKSKNGNFHGRVTDFLNQFPPEKGTLVYLCGNSNMIIDARKILIEQGIPHEDIFTEVYF